MISFDPNTQISTVTIVGCGGTGAQLVRSVARMVCDMREARMHTPQVILIDPDIVERPNVGRQLFSEADVGQPKAQVLMRRFNLALGLSMTAICEPVDAERHFERWGNLIIGCVDNHLARRELAKVNGAIWCDSGNHANAGQVVIGNTGDRDLVLRHLDGRNGKVGYLPHAGLLFPALFEPDADAEPAPQPETSCAELVAARSQELLINDWMAVATAQYVYKLLHRQPITSFATFISSDGMSAKSMLIVADEIRTYLEATPA